FGSTEKNPEVPPRAGYLLGWRIAETAGRTRSLAQLASMTPAESRALIERALRERGRARRRHGLDRQGEVGARRPARSVTSRGRARTPDATRHRAVAGAPEAETGSGRRPFRGRCGPRGEAGPSPGAPSRRSGTASF